MGGTALGYQSRRIKRNEYNSIVSHVKSFFYHNFNSPVWDIEAYDLKETFGDIDFLIDASDFQNAEEIKTHILSLSTNKKINSNGNIHSVDYHGVQLDFILVNNLDDMIPYYFYTCFDPLGNLLGRYARKLGGLKLGIDGLSYPVRIENYQVARIPISKNPETILSFFGLDYETYMRGFQAQKDIFDFVINSPFFNRDIINLQNYIDRKRDAKRPSWNAFVQYVEETKPENKHDFKEKEYYFDYIESFFPNFKETREKYIKEALAKRELKQKFSRCLDVIRNDKGLEGKDLGIFVADFKKKFLTDEAFFAMIRDNTEESISQKLNSHHRDKSL